MTLKCTNASKLPVTAVDRAGETYMATARILLLTAVLAFAGQMAPTGASAQVTSPLPSGTTMPDMSQMRRTEQPRTADEVFLVLDDNGDGCVSAEEWRLRFMAVFFMLDTEGQTTIPGSKGDERLTITEVPALKPELFAEADSDHDGVVSAYEYNQAPFTRYIAIRKTKKNCVTKDDIAAYLAGLRTELN